MRKRRSLRNAQVITVLVMAAFLGLIGRLVFISTHDGEALLSRANRQHRSVIPIRSRRGKIADSRGFIFATTVLRRSVFADPKIIPDKQEAARRVAAILGLDAVELGDDLVAAGDRRFFVIQRGVTEAQAGRIRQSGIHGLGVFDEPARSYPMNGIAASIIGFVSPDGVGVTGLERQCDEWLRGENGHKTIIRDAGRKAFWLADHGYRPSRDGLHLILTLDAEIQAIVEHELMSAVGEYDAESGFAIAMQPKTGAILAMVNVPGFDPGRYRDYDPERYRNRTITDPFEPGSTFKPVIAAAALAENVVRLDEVIDCEGGLWTVGTRRLHDHHPYGKLSFVDVLVKSSNIGMAKIGTRLGKERLYAYVKQFGFGEKTGIDLQAEDRGILRPLDRWDDYSVTSVPMGQEIAVTAVQLVRAFCVFANGGMLVQPHVLRAVLAADGRIVNDFSNPPPVGRAISEEIAETIKNKILLRVVSSGNSRAKLSNYQVFGKTGTAQIPKRGGGGYERDAYVGSFVGGAPARNPQVMVLVSVRRPDRSLGYYGGTVAAPAARRILARTLAYLQIPPDDPPASVNAGQATWPVD
ncbi:MAG: penicillin-binding protein 2 [Planctomycetota bacterium]|nr:penicillin-binding protein 2 [Planctomycetota bacterium]